MGIYVVGSTGDNREAVGHALQVCLPEASIWCMDLDDLRPCHPSPAAAFVLVDNMHGLLCLRKVAELYTSPVVVVSSSPDFALEGIRYHVRDYLIPPILENDLHRALWRLGFYEGGNAHAPSDYG